MLLAHHLFRATPAGTRADSDTWQGALSGAQRDTNGEVVALWEGLNSTERRLVAIIADGRLRLHSRQASARWRLVDPLFALWLASGREWPD
jgi:hypothetical protein